MSSESRWQVGEEEAGERLDRHIAAHLGKARSQVQKWIKKGHVTVSGRAAKASTPVEVGQEIHCQPPPSDSAARLEPEAGDLQLLYADAHLAIIDKPAGLAIHPGAGRSTGTLVHRLLHHFPEIGQLVGRDRPGIVHRLDLDTTGALVVARTDVAQQRLQAAFAERSVDKTYLAVSHGVPSPAYGQIDEPIGRHPQDRKRMTIRPEGRPASTGYRTLASRPKIASALEVQLYTGRTHQIRVHLKAIGHPLIGDPTYGEARWRSAPRPVQKALVNFHRPALHAWKLSLPHPITGQVIDAKAPVPEDLIDLWLQLGGSAEDLQS